MAKLLGFCKSDRCMTYMPTSFVNELKSRWLEHVKSTGESISFTHYLEKYGSDLLNSIFSFYGFNISILNKKR